MTIFFASQNQGKIAEAFDLLMARGHQLFTFNDQNLLKAKGIIFPNDFSIEESGKTLAENALLKAKAVAEISQLPTLADDSGLLLNAFPGFPGVRSRRWHEGSDQDRNRALLKKMKTVDDRGAKFQTVLALFDPKTNEEELFYGEVEGQIAEKPLGEAGFGYDPLFIPENYQASFSQLGLDIKNKISHRAKAWEKFAAYLAKQG